MGEHEHLSDDSLSAMLGMNARQCADDELRGAVLARTIGVMRCRRRLRRLTLAAGLLGCYLAGIMTVWSPRFVPEGHAVRAAAAVKQVPRHVAPATTPRPSESDIVQVATAAPSAYQSWRRIGDHYLRESDDISLALAGYKQALDLATEKELAIAPGQDNWLLMALKDARMKESRYARHE